MCQFHVFFSFSCVCLVLKPFVFLPLSSKCAFDANLGQIVCFVNLLRSVLEKQMHLGVLFTQRSMSICFRTFVAWVFPSKTTFSRHVFALERTAKINFVLIWCFRCHCICSVSFRCKFSSRQMLTLRCSGAGCWKVLCPVLSISLPVLSFKTWTGMLTPRYEGKFEWSGFRCAPESGAVLWSYICIVVLTAPKHRIAPVNDQVSRNHMRVSLFWGSKINSFFK